VVARLRTVEPDGLQPPKYAYSHGIQAGPLIFVAGEISVDPKGQLVGEGDIATQTRQTITNVRSVLRAAGADLSDVTSTTVFLKDLRHFSEYEKVYAECFGAHRPARATVRADLVRPGALIEIQAVAVLTGPSGA